MAPAEAHSDPLPPSSMPVVVNPSVLWGISLRCLTRSALTTSCTSCRQSLKTKPNTTMVKATYSPKKTVVELACTLGLHPGPLTPPPNSSKMYQVKT